MHTTNLLVAIAALSSVGLLASAERPTKKLRTNKRKTQKNKDGGDIMDEEDIVFWTRLLQGGDTDRGKETDFMSMPTVPRPPAGGVSDGFANSL